MKKLHDLKQQCIAYITQKPLDILILLVFLAAIMKLATLYLSVDSDIDNWEEFKTEHQCKARISDTSSKISSWKCNDGKVYYNWRQQR